MKKLILLLTLLIAFTSISFGYSSSSFGGGCRSSFSSSSFRPSSSFSSYSRPSSPSYSSVSIKSPATSFRTASVTSTSTYSRGATATSFRPTSTYTSTSYTSTAYRPTTYLYRSAPTTVYSNHYYTPTFGGYHYCSYSPFNNPFIWYMILSNHNGGYNNNVFNTPTNTLDDWGTSSKSHTEEPHEDNTLQTVLITILVMVVIFGVGLAVWQKIESWLHFKI